MNPFVLEYVKVVEHKHDRALGCESLRRLLRETLDEASKGQCRALPERGEGEVSEVGLDLLHSRN